MSHQLVPSVRKILCNTTNPEPVGMHSSATNCFDDVEYFFTVGEHVEYWRKLAKVLRKCSEPNEVAVDAEQLAQHYTNNFCAIREFNARKFFNCQQVSQIIHDATEIINPVGIGNVSVPALTFTHLLGAAMVKTYFRYRFNDIFTIKLKNYSQYTMCAGVLWSYVKEHIVCIIAVFFQSPFLGLEA